MCINFLDKIDRVLGSKRTAGTNVTMASQPVMILELFSGVGSVAALGSRFLQCNAISVDIDASRKPTICADIGELSDAAIQSLKTAFQGVQWILWASPPCDQYSRAHTCGTRDLERADALTQRMWRFVDILKPERVLIENPESSLLWKRDFMLARQGFTLQVDYCQYGTAYKKPTQLWTDKPLVGFVPKRCPGPGRCPAIAPTTRRHIVSIDGCEDRTTVAAIPDRLVLEIFQGVHHSLPARGKRIEGAVAIATAALTNPVVGVVTYKVMGESWRFKVTHADGSVAWKELADMPDDFDRLSWPSKLRAKFAVDPAPFPYERIVEVALDGDTVLIRVKWTKCQETSWLRADVAAMRDIATSVKT